MKRAHIFVWLLLCLPPALAACGPKEVGEDMSDDYALSGSHDRLSNAEAMRYPVTGAGNIQERLYHYNRPAVMENVQNWRLGQYRRMMGIAPETNPEDPAYRAVPKQKSPFRQ